MTLPQKGRVPGVIYLVVTHDRHTPDQYIAYRFKHTALNAIRDFKAQYKPLRVQWRSPKMEGYTYVVDCEEGGMWAGIRTLEVVGRESTT